VAFGFTLYLDGETADGVIVVNNNTGATGVDPRTTWAVAPASGTGSAAAERHRPAS
jgi:hypothetical protein